MELNQQIATLQDEVKVLKGEVKNILKEIRAAILSRDNPFAPEGTPQLRPLALPGTDAPASPSGAGASDPGDGPFQAAPAPAPAEAPAPWIEAAAAAPVAVAAVAPAVPTIEAPPAAPVARAYEEPAPPRWSLLTIATLTAWAEEAVQALGRQRFQMVLDLATFAGIVTNELRDVLNQVARLAPAGEKHEQPTTINQCLVLLRQLEAILNGEDPGELSLRRAARRQTRGRQ
jgi:hypothetical protein